MAVSEESEAIACDNRKDKGEEKQVQEDPFRELTTNDTYQLPDSPLCLLLGFRWEATSNSAVCDLDAVTVFFDNNARALALVDCVQGTYSNVAALIDDSVYNLPPGLDEDLEKMVIDLTRVEKRTTTIVVGIRSMSMTFQAHAVKKIKCTCTSLRFRKFSNVRRDDLAPAWHLQIVSSSRLFSVEHETLKDQRNNVVTLFVISRTNAREPWRVSTVFDELQCHDTTALKDRLSGYVACPTLSAVARKLPSIPALCMALTSRTLPAMKDKFFTKGAGRGLGRKSFVREVFMHLYQTMEGLHAKDDTARVVAMLDELFDQIDINSNGFVDWEEFTSFCIELAIISVKGTNSADFQPDDFSIQYQPAGVPSMFMNEDSAKFALGPSVEFMTFVPELKLIYYAERRSDVLKVLDTAGKPHHQYKFLDACFVEGHPVTILTVAYIPGRYLVVVCSDHSVNLMKKVKNGRGRIHSYNCEVKFVHQLMHTKILWEPYFQTLVSVGADNHIYVWKVEDMKVGPRRIYLEQEHTKTITDIIYIAGKELIVTCSLDRRVSVWQMPSWKLRASFRDHSLGVQALSYLRGTLLSASFDWNIIAWDLERIEKIGTMTGHKAPVMAVSQMMCPTNFQDIKAISADSSFEARTWDLSGCTAGGKTIPCLMVFQLSCPKDYGLGPRSLCLPFDIDHSVKGYSNIIIAGHSVTSYTAFKIKKEFFVPPVAVYNSSSAHFVAALKQSIHVWDATSGDYLRKLIKVSPSPDIVSACFALPFERRLLLGTEDGRILLVNYVTGAVINESHPHAAEVTQIAYCKSTEVVISADHDGVVVISSERQRKLKKLRKVKDVHGPGVGVAHMAYSYRLSKIVTCPSSAELQLLGFENLSFMGAVVQSAGEPTTGVALLDRYSIIVLGDTTQVCLWHLDMDTSQMSCFAKLVVPRRALDLPMDVLSYVRVLRREKTDDAVTTIVGVDSDADTATAPLVHFETGKAQDESNPPASREHPQTGRHLGVKPSAIRTKAAAARLVTNVIGAYVESTCCEEEIWIALGTESGRLACWAWEDILRAFEALPTSLKLRPVPDCLCPSLSPSFNPYFEEVKKRKRSSKIYTILDNSGSATGCSDTTQTVEGEDCQCPILEKVLPRAVWRGHAGPVSRIGSCLQPPCFFTLGDDGFQRIWSTEGKILGQFALPNASEIQIKRRLFPNSRWNFLVDAVRVRPRPFHEDLAASLLKEAGKRRAQQKSSVSFSASGAHVASMGGVAEMTPIAENSFRTVSTGVSVDVAASRSPIEVLDESPRASHLAVSSAVRSAVSTQSDGLGGGNIIRRSTTRADSRGKKVKYEATEDAAAEGETIEGKGTRREELEKETEHRQAATETIEQHNAHKIRSSSTRSEAILPTTDGDEVSLLSSLTSLTTSPSCLGILKQPAAFTSQSVRRGIVSGLYDKEEASTLLAISKNPSRVAAYNRIVNGKQGHDKLTSQNISRPIQIRRVRPRREGALLSKPALLFRATGLKLEGSSNNHRNKEKPAPSREEDSAGSFAIPSTSAPSPAESASTKRLREPFELGSECARCSAFEGNSFGDGDGLPFERERVEATTQPTPFFAAKMYSNAAREFGKGHSAGLTMWRDLEGDSSDRAVTRVHRGSSKSTKFNRKTLLRGHRSSSSLSSSTADCSPKPNLLQLRELGSTMTREKRIPSDCGNRTNEREEGGHEDYEQDWKGGDSSLESMTSANDWSVATGDDREDTLDRSKSQSSGRVPGWEDTHAFRQKTARRTLARRAPPRDDVSRLSTLTLTSVAPPSEEWNWDWSKRPTSILPADRVEFLLCKIDNALETGRVSPAATLASSASLPLLKTTSRVGTAARTTTLGGEGGRLLKSSVSSPSTASDEPGMDGGPRAKNDNMGSGMVSPRVVPGNIAQEQAAVSNTQGLKDQGDEKQVCLVSSMAQKKANQLANLQQRVIALLVKNNDRARRREAKDPPRIHKRGKNVLGKGPRPGKLGPHYTLQSVMEFRAAFNFVDENMSGALDFEEWKKFLERFKSNVGLVNMRSMFLHLDKNMSYSVEVGELVPIIFSKASSAQHHLMRHLIEYENAREAKRVSGKTLVSTVSSDTLQLGDMRELFELYDTSNSGYLDHKSIKRMLRGLKVPQLSWDAFARVTPQLQTSPDGRLTAEEFTVGFFEAFIS